MDNPTLPPPASGSFISGPEVHKPGSRMRNGAEALSTVVRQGQQEPPDGQHVDDSLIGFNPLALIPCHDSSCLQAKFRHGIGQCGDFPLPRRRVPQRLANLDQAAGASARGDNEIHFPTGSGPVVENLGIESAEGGENQVLE